MRPVNTKKFSLKIKRYFKFFVLFAFFVLTFLFFSSILKLIQAKGDDKLGAAYFYKCPDYPP